MRSRRTAQAHMLFSPPWSSMRRYTDYRQRMRISMTRKRREKPMAKGWYLSGEFKRRMLRLPEKVRKDTNRAIEQNADEWVRVSRSMAPVDPKDGIHLKPSIRHYETETGGQVVRAGGEATTRPVKDGQSATYDYALAQEFGTQEMAANPFFWPAYRLFKKKFASRRSRAMNKAIKDFNNGQ
ncbi:hypothetical protein F9L03_02075 [Brucella lupini]|uniref:HK97 gp10 family phage protein n=2 Tax=Brucella lupini TaxID=255457 RepID=A0AB34DRH2_9HYPH|nr:hypothetical protein F9L03_02075 [Brucella lupini]